MDLARRGERQSVDDDRMNDRCAQQLKQRRHVGPEFIGMSRPAGRNAVEDRATAAEKEAECIPQLEPRQAEARGKQASPPTAIVCDPKPTNSPPGARHAKERRKCGPPIASKAASTPGRPAVCRRTEVTKSPT